MLKERLPIRPICTFAFKEKTHDHQIRPQAPQMRKGHRGSNPFAIAARFSPVLVLSLLILAACAIPPTYAPVLDPTPEAVETEASPLPEDKASQRSLEKLNCVTQLLEPIDDALFSEVAFIWTSSTRVRPSTSTKYLSINHLPSGSYVVMDQDGVVIDRYHRPAQTYPTRLDELLQQPSFLCLIQEILVLMPSPPGD